MSRRRRTPSQLALSSRVITIASSVIAAHVRHVVNTADACVRVSPYLQHDDLRRVRLGELLQLRGDELARAAPGGMEVDDHQQLSGGGQLGVEVLLLNSKRRE